jgi:hypothetical protein
MGVGVHGHHAIRDQASGIRNQDLPILMPDA